MESFKKVYKITMQTSDRALLHYYFARGFTWEVICDATKEANEFEKEKGKKWAVIDIKRIY